VALKSVFVPLSAGAIKKQKNKSNTFYLRNYFFPTKFLQNFFSPQLTLKLDKLECLSPEKSSG